MKSTFQLVATKRGRHNRESSKQLKYKRKCRLKNRLASWLKHRKWAICGSLANRPHHGIPRNAGKCASFSGSAISSEFWRNQEFFYQRGLKRNKMGKIPHLTCGLSSMIRSSDFPSQTETRQRELHHCASRRLAMVTGTGSVPGVYRRRLCCALWASVIQDATSCLSGIIVTAGSRASCRQRKVNAPGSVGDREKSVQHDLTIIWCTSIARVDCCSLVISAIVCASCSTILTNSAEEPATVWTFNLCAGILRIQFIIKIAAGRHKCQ